MNIPVAIFVRVSKTSQDYIDKDEESETSSLNQLYGHLEQSINNFKFKTLPEENLQNNADINIDIEVFGGEAFFKLFEQIYCSYHGSPDELFQTQSVSELYSLLMIMDLLLDKLQITKSRNKEILLTLVKHQFNYRIANKLRELDSEALKISYCQACECDHGLPEDLRLLIDGIRLKIENKTALIASHEKNKVI